VDENPWVRLERSERMTQFIESPGG